MDGKQGRGILIKKRIPVRKNETIEAVKTLPDAVAARTKVVPVGEIKQAAVRGVFGKKMAASVPAQDYSFAPVEKPVAVAEPVVVPVAESVNPFDEPVAVPLNPFDDEPIPAAAVVPKRAKPTTIAQELPAPTAKLVLPSLNTKGCADVPTKEEYQPYKTSIQEIEKDTKYKIPKAQPYQPVNRYFFNRMIPTIYKDYAIKERTPVDYNACNKMSVQTYNYQQFIREYMRLEAPSRGILVYHGLGSGKTCSAIGAAEAIFSDSTYSAHDGTMKPRKIIVMTPSSLKENFINEISFCGFKHYSVKNHWTPLQLLEADGKTYNMAVVCFAKSVLNIPQSYIEKLTASSKARIWVADFTKPANFDQLSADIQDEIKQQIRKIITDRIEFIGYTGLTRTKLKEWVMNDPTHFDNAVIVIDEVHNLTRLMRGKLEKYLVQKAAAKPGAKPAKETATPISYEPVTTQRWSPKLVTQDKHYERGFLIYRLLAEARNSKIIALSGTPIVNYPDEIAILGNMLHGYFHSATISCAAIPDDAKAIAVLKAHDRVDFYSVSSGEQKSIFFTLLEPGFKKVHDKDDNVVYDGATEYTIESVAEEVKTLLKAAGVVIKETTIAALPLFPLSKSEFENTFVNKTTVRMQNSLVFLKRMAGLISYYKGGRKDYMPAVNRDVVVEIPMSAHMLGPYIEARGKEREIEKVKEKPGAAAAQVTESVGWGVISGLPEEGSKKQAASYRFRSRAMCNFVFPKGIARPFPKDAKEAVATAAVGNITYGDRSEEVEGVGAVVADEATVTEVKAIEAQEEAEVDAEADETTMALPQDDTIVGIDVSEEERKKLQDMTYDDRIRYTIEKLEAGRESYFKLDAADPLQRLDTYSPKFARIMQNVSKAPGSSLVYSQFKTLEGIGIFSIALKANGYEQVRIITEGGVMKFHPDTVASFLQKPAQPRYMIFSGDEEPTVRQALMNTFNMKWDEGLTKELKEVLDQAAGLRASGNLKGEVCRVFMITGAGAEGLSLKNVRAVHIMEPYWNKVRLDQVKGRAVRICSHKDLPQKDRNVDIFTYVSMITKEQMATAQEIEFQDEGLTSDQYIYGVSLRKETLNNDFLNTVQVGAVDCENNQIENNMYKCFSVKDSETNEFLYDPRLAQDIATTTTEFGDKNKEIKPRIVKDLPAAILDKAPPRVKALFADRPEGRLIFTEMISDKGAHYYGIFTDEEKTHPQPFDADRELGTYDSKTGKVAFHKAKTAA